MYSVYSCQIRIKRRKVLQFYDSKKCQVDLTVRSFIEPENLDKFLIFGYYNSIN
jgi:hypothetical protein